MKLRYLTYIALPLMMIMSGCENKVEDLFGEPADTRLGRTVKECHDVLTGSQYGWRFAYEPNANYCARFFMKFTEDKVEMASDFNANNSISSYTFDYGQGPVLNFNTYGLLHYLADPGVAPTGTGYGGDFEFIVMDVKADTIFLKGKKNQDRVKLCIAREGDEANYFENSKRLKSFLTKGKDSPFFSSIVFNDGNGLVFNAGKNNRYLELFIVEGEKIETRSVAYDFDADGFVLDQGIKALGKEIRFFEWYQYDVEDESGNVTIKSSFRTKDGTGEIKFTHTTPIPLGKTVDKYVGQTLTGIGFSSSLQSSYDKLKNSVSTLSDIHLKIGVDGVSNWNFNTTSGSNTFEIASFNKLRDDQIEIVGGEGAEGSDVARLQRNPNFKQLIAYFNSPNGFTVFESNDKVYFIDRTNSQNWFTFKVK